MQQISWEVVKIYPLKIDEIIYWEFLFISYFTYKLCVLRETGPLAPTCTAALSLWKPHYLLHPDELVIFELSHVRPQCQLTVHQELLPTFLIQVLEG